jgi:hypothetical protein
VNVFIIICCFATEIRYDLTLECIGCMINTILFMPGRRRVYHHMLFSSGNMSRFNVGVYRFIFLCLDERCDLRRDV